MNGAEEAMDSFENGNGLGLIFLDQGKIVKPPKLSGKSSDAFSAQRIVFAKKTWLPDESVAECPGCNNKFTTLRRKHHCRQCGQIYCKNCCSNKMLLPYLGYTEPERICNPCMPYIQLMLWAFSTETAKRYESVERWMAMVKTEQGIKDVVESGGAHILVNLTREKDLRMRSLCLKCFNEMAAYPCLQRFLIEIGIIKALCRILVDTADLQTTLAIDSLNLLLTFCQNPDRQAEVLEHGAMPAVLDHCWQAGRPSTPVALRCISALCEHERGCDIIVNCRDKHYLNKLVALAREQDLQIQELALQIIANLSSCSDYHRQRILQEEVFSGGQLASVLINRPDNVQCLINITSLMANLAVTQNTQGGLMDHLQGMCTLIEDHKDRPLLMQNVARGLANFSRYKHNCDILKDYFPQVVSAFLCSRDSCLRQRGFQISVALLQHFPSHCISVLHRNGVTEFLQCLSERKEALAGLQSGLQDRLPDIIRPSSLQAVAPPQPPTS